MQTHTLNIPSIKVHGLKIEKHLCVACIVEESVLRFSTQWQIYHLK